MKKLILFLILFLCFTLHASAWNPLIIGSGTSDIPSITFDAESEGTWTNWDTSLAWSHTLTAQTTSILVVGVATRGGGADWEANDCVWDSGGTPENMILSEVIENSAFASIALYYLDSPNATGTKTITCTPSAAGQIHGMAMSFYNASETGSGSTTDTSSTQASGASITDTLTTGSANSWVVSIGFHDDGESVAPSQGETEVEEDPQADSVLAMAYELIAVAAQNTFGWDGTGTDDWSIILAEFEPE
jgi:hypothetical protein